MSGLFRRGDERIRITLGSNSDPSMLRLVVLGSSVNPYNLILWHYNLATPSHLIPYPR